MRRDAMGFEEDIKAVTDLENNATDLLRRIDESRPHRPNGREGGSLLEWQP